MTIHRAIKHFNWRFKNGIKPTENDVKAFNTIVKFVKDKHQKQFNDYQLFAKIYISFYGELLRYYNATVFDKEPQKALHKILDTPIEELIKKFISKATDIEQAKEYTVNGILKHPKQLSNQELKDITIIDEIMSYDEAKDNLTAMINLAINQYKNDNTRD